MNKFHSILRVERTDQIKGGQFQPVRSETRGKYGADDPRSIMEDAERIPEPTQEELAHALGRILVWILAGGSMTRIGERAVIVAYKLRPDLIQGATLATIAGAMSGRAQKLWRSYANKLQRQFTRTFGIRGLNDHAQPARRPWGPLDEGQAARSHGVVDSHLKLVNRFQEWRTFHDEGRGSIPRDHGERQRLIKDFAPLRRYLDDLEGAD